MTEKRFQNQGKDIFQYGEWWCSAGGEHCADVIATAMNEIINKNTQLKKDNKEYIRGLKLRKAECQSWASDVRELRKQNYQLEKENENLREKIESLDEIIDNQIYKVKHTHKNCKKVGIIELKKLKKVLICHNIIQEGDINEIR